MITTMQLTKSYGSTPVLRGVNLHVPPGEIYTLLGRNGAGKTTLINILITLTRPDAGTASVAGFDVLADALDGVVVRRVVGLRHEKDPHGHLRAHVAQRLHRQDDELVPRKPEAHAHA